MGLLAFQYYETRPCLQIRDDPDNTAVSFTTIEAFDKAVAECAANELAIETYWTVFGVDENGEATPVGDVTSREEVVAVLHAILSPMQAALQALDPLTLERADAVDTKRRAIMAGELITSFILECSTADRI